VPSHWRDRSAFRGPTNAFTKGAKTVIIQVVNFNLKDLSDADYRNACDGLAPELARVPGLMSKVWLADETSNTYGGVYTWVDRQAMDAFARSDFFKAFAANPNFANITSRAFGILEGPSQVTRASIAIAA
jgi:quinol monooxygenase YgiN